MLRLLAETLEAEGYRIYSAGGGLEALKLLKQVRIDAVLIDLATPRMDGLELLKRIRKDFPALMVIMLTDRGEVGEAIAAVKMGADDFLEKPIEPDALRARVTQLFKIWRFRQENRKMQAEVKNQFAFPELIGNSSATLKLKELIAEAGPSDATVLILGETGTDKELVARALHAHSPRADKRFVTVDCAAINEAAIESELFGHVKGAFAGAHTAALGLIRLAHQGTLFLDDVAELAPAIQGKLLRTLQERKVRPVGSSRGHAVDLRVLAAANRDLAAAVADGSFREDLFYRLNVLTITLPPLRDHPEDVALLAEYFLKRFTAGRLPVPEISSQALECLESYNWPGNVRELENVIRRAVVLGRGGVIQPEDVFRCCRGY